MHFVLVAVALASTAAVQAQQLPSTLGGAPALRALSDVEARAPEPLRSIAAARGLPDGRVLVNDIATRRVLLFDSTLARYTVVADSTSATGNAYSGHIGGLIPYRGDSTLFVDPQALTMLVIDHAGGLGRTLAVPRPNDAFSLTGLAFGTPGFDAAGRLVYRAQQRPTASVSALPDSAPLVRVDLTTRKADTAAFVKTEAPKVSATWSADGGVASLKMIVNPLPVVDDWAVLSDGTITVLRGRDFHADFVGADGVLRAAPRIPYAWQRMSDEAKAAFLDSTRTAIERQRAAHAAAAQNRAGGASRDRAPVGGDHSVPTTFELVPASELPDYKAPFAAGAARADADGRVWVRLIPTEPMPGAVYAVIDGHGRLVERVLIPAQAAIAGFGPGGAVYLGVQDKAGVHLERRRVR